MKHSSTITKSIVFAGHVDHGKSTLIGRLLFDTDSLAKGQKEAILETCSKRGKEIEWAFLLDAFQAEREQGVTIDFTQIFFNYKEKRYVIIDVPGHKEFIKNMVSGAANADSAVLIVDVNEGVSEQTKRHAYLLSLLGIEQIIIAINKMDVVNYSEEKFKSVKQEVIEYLAGLNCVPHSVVPICAKSGENIVNPSKNMEWYKDHTLLYEIDKLNKAKELINNSLRLPVQDVYKFDHRRIIVGRIKSGVVKVGDEIIFLPSEKTAYVKSIETWNTKNPKLVAKTNESVGITLTEELFIEKGEMISHKSFIPMLSDVFMAKVFWFLQEPLEVNQKITIKLDALEVQAVVEKINHVVDFDSLKNIKSDGISRHAIGEVVLRTKKKLPLDELTKDGLSSKFVFVKNHSIVGGGIASLQGYPDQREVINVDFANIFNVESRVTQAMRNYKYGHKGGAIWMTGLSGAGKTTLALALEKTLFLNGYKVFILDGDNMRHHLCSDLGFSPNDRGENIRRVKEVAALFVKAGFIVITAFISPFKAGRINARKDIKNFHEVYVKASIDVCKSRDPKGLYNRVEKGDINEFTGVDSVYEQPDNPEITIDTEQLDVSESVNLLEAYVDKHFTLDNEVISKTMSLESEAKDIVD